MTGSPDTHWSSSSTVPREAREFQGNRAGFVTRSIAVGFDFTIVAGVVLLLYLGYAVVLFVFNPSNPQLPDVPAGLVLITGGITAHLLFTRRVGDHGTHPGSTGHGDPGGELPGQGDEDPGRRSAGTVLHLSLIHI